MDPITRQAIAVAGGAAAGDPLYVDEVFSTFLYRGTASSAQTITNGIDLSGEGGLVWIKNRDSSDENTWIDTERGANKYLMSHSSSAQQTNSAQITSFNSGGFSLGAANQVNRSGNAFVSWTFRKAPGFFDVVTYTGNGTAGRTVSHNLGSVPGFIIVKRYSATEDWTCYHRSIGATKYLQLNSTYAEVDDDRAWNDTEPTSSVFTVGTHDRVNTNGQDYVAYVFAHDDQSFGTNEDEAIIKCGSFSSNSSGHYTVNLGFEPQFLLMKATNSSGGWFVFDNMRGIGMNSVALLRAESNGTDGNYPGEGYLNLHPNGFKSTLNLLGANLTFAYMAIRRPNKPPQAGTDVFTAALTGTPGSGGVTQWRPENVDMAWFAKRGGDAKNFHVADRIRGFQNTNANGDDTYTTPTLKTNSSGAELTSGTAIHQSSFSSGTIDVRAVSSGSNFLFYRFKRAPGFFDVVAYTGNGSNRTISHNLGSVPEMILVKMRSSGDSWQVYNGSTGATHYLTLNLDWAAVDNDSRFNDTEPTASVFTLGNDNGVNQSGRTFIAYLFATLDGISKVGSYTGTGYAVNVDCGFTNGARFVMIKRTDSSGDWYVWDTTRGIVSGNDPYLLLNSTAAEVTNTDYIDPLNAGFTVSSSAPAALNTSGGTYIFLAIA